jgi:hypothetical protein
VETSSGTKTTARSSNAEEFHVPVSDGGVVYGPCGAWRHPRVFAAILGATRTTGRFAGREPFAGSVGLARSPGCTLPGPMLTTIPTAAEVIGWPPPVLTAQFSPVQFVNDTSLMPAPIVARAQNLFAT